MRHTAEFLGNVIYRPVATSIQAVGFKVFYTHLYDVPDLERFLLAHDDIRIVHLKRRNLLHTFISSRIAAKTNVYGISSADAIQKTTIVVDTDKCLRYLQDQQQAIARYDTLLRDRSVLDVQYTDLSDSYESTMARVQAFLDVEPRTLSSSRVKQNPYSLREIVENYDELEEALRGLPWEEFLVS
jgi:LPS sulfotransferase NodH